LSHPRACALNLPGNMFGCAAQMAAITNRTDHLPATSFCSVIGQSYFSASGRKMLRFIFPFPRTFTWFVFPNSPDLSCRSSFAEDRYQEARTAITSHFFTSSRSFCTFDDFFFLNFEACRNSWGSHLHHGDTSRETRADSPLTFITGCPRYPAPDHGRDKRTNRYDSFILSLFPLKARTHSFSSTAQHTQRRQAPTTATRELCLALGLHNVAIAAFTAQVGEMMARASRVPTARRHLARIASIHHIAHGPASRVDKHNCFLSSSARDFRYLIFGRFQ
jgi:hypothetical protein